MSKRKKKPAVNKLKPFNNSGANGGPLYTRVTKTKKVKTIGKFILDQLP